MVKGLGELGSWTHSHCPGAAAAPQHGLVLVPCWQKWHISHEGGALSPPAAARPMQGADGAHLERAVSAKEKPIIELITDVM